MTTWRFLHVACMLGAFTIGVGEGTLAHHVVTTGDVAAMRRVLPTWDRTGNLVGIPLLVLGLGFGFVASLTGGFDLTAPCLLMVVGILVHGSPCTTANCSGSRTRPPRVLWSSRHRSWSRMCFPTTNVPSSKLPAGVSG